MRDLYSLFRNYAQVNRNYAQVNFRTHVLFALVCLLIAVRGFSNKVTVKYFEVQCSTDGQSYTTITKLNASNNITNTKYQYNDGAGCDPIYYYRLKMADQDGSFTYSKAVAVETADRYSQVKSYPNPAKDYVIVKHPLISHAAQLAIVDMAGKVVKTVKVERNVSQTRVAVKGLLSGTYQIIWKDGNSFINQTLVIE